MNIKFIIDEKYSDFVPRAYIEVSTFISKIIGIIESDWGGL